MPGTAKGDGPRRARPVFLFQALRGWSRKDLGGDVAAGLTLAAIAIPEQMATARLGGFSPQVGFYAFVAGSAAFAALGASRSLSAGADSTITPIFAGGLAVLAVAGSPAYAGLAAMLAVMVGVLVLVSGLLRFGWIADLLSAPVMAGFLAGISIHIVITQLPDLLGLPPGHGSVFDRLDAVVANAAGINPISMVLGFAVFVALLLAERLSARIPAALIALALASLATTTLDLGSHGVAVLGALPEGVPRIARPAIAVEELRTLAPLALLVALVVLVQTAATTRAFPGARSASPDVNRDFVGVGAAGVAAGMIGAFPVNASPPRTAIVVETGGRSQMAGLVAATIVLALALLGGRLLADVPHAALAGILLFIAARLLRWQTFLGTFRKAPVEFALIVVTTAAIVTLPIEVGASLGIGLSLLHGLWSSTQAHVVELERIPGTTIWWPPDGGPGGERVDGVLVVAFQAPLSFVNADRFRRQLGALVAARAGSLELVVLEANSVADIDYTAADALSDLMADCRAAGVRFAIARLESVRAQAALARFGLAEKLGRENIFRSVENAIEAWSSQRLRPPAANQTTVEAPAR